VTRLLQNFVPDVSVRTVYDIDLEKLWNDGFRGIITDLDNTLVGARVEAATPELVKWLDTVQERGFKVVIVSNNYHSRVSKFADPLGIPFINSARKPTAVPFRKALGILGTRPLETAVIGDQLMTDVLGGNRMGLYTILVHPIARHEEGIATKLINRPLEKLALLLLRKKRG
jgi:uncharacterized protein